MRIGNNGRGELVVAQYLSENKRNIVITSSFESDTKKITLLLKDARINLLHVC